MVMKIEQPIVGYAVNEMNSAGALANLNGESVSSSGAETANVIQMDESLKRPEVLVGSTYKLKVPDHVSEHAMYITINDYVLNEGTEHEMRRPYEVFINTKNLDHYQWIVALTVIMSAVFRKGGDITFLVDELKSVFDPRGGYWVKGVYKASIIAEIGDVIERHLIKIGLLDTPELEEHQKELIRKKKEELAAAKAPSMKKSASTEQTANQVADGSTDDFPAEAKLCKKCNNRAAIFMDGCMTCLNCGDSKCG